MTKFMEIANELGHKKVILHTQTTSWLAAKLYLDFGFEILNIDEVNGWRILKTITNHEKLSNYEPFNYNEIFDKRNVEIENQLIKLYGTEDFNYGVWYKNGLHNVYTYINGETEEFEYFVVDGHIELRKVQNKKYKK